MKATVSIWNGMYLESSPFEFNNFLEFEEFTQKITSDMSVDLIDENSTLLVIAEEHSMFVVTMIENDGSTIYELHKQPKYPSQEINGELFRVDTHQMLAAVEYFMNCGTINPDLLWRKVDTRNIELPDVNMDGIKRKANQSWVEETYGPWIAERQKES